MGYEYCEAMFVNVVMWFVDGSIFRRLCSQEGVAISHVHIATFFALYRIGERDALDVACVGSLVVIIISKKITKLLC